VSLLAADSRTVRRNPDEISLGQFDAILNALLNLGDRALAKSRFCVLQRITILRRAFRD
jgi:hypothetical protein